MNVYGVIFIGIMAKAILEFFIFEFEALLSGDIGKRVLEEKIKEIVSQNVPLDEKICPNCQTKNRTNAKFCN